MVLRIKNIPAKLEQQNLDALIICSPANISYLTKYTSRDSYLLASKKKNIYFTDFRYLQEVKENLKGFTVVINKTGGSIFALIAAACRNLGCKHLGFEENNLSFAEYKKLKENVRAGLELIPTHNLIEGLRQIKTPQEIAKIKKAIQITVSALKFIENFIKPGIKEIEVVAELERFLRYQGASGSAFDIIVASGPNSSFPHHISSQRKLKSGEVMLIDLGCDYLGYKSDLTRVFFLGKINSLGKKIYAIVRSAQDRAIKKIKPGCRACEIDRVSRQYITQKGYAGFFGHNLGHGIGLEVHEAPRLSAKENTRLKPGMVFTIEPGIYLPHKFGIRIEDMVLVTKKGCEVLSGALHK